jgi:2-aminoadipate transaminase
MDFEKLLAKDAPPAARRWGGFPKYNFTGGHNDPEMVPVAALISSSERAIERNGQALATYNLDSGPQGHGELRRFVVEKLRDTRDIDVTVEEVLITTGSMQGIHLVNQLLIEPGDTVVAELFTFNEALASIRRRGGRVVGVPLDDHGLRSDRLEQTLADLRQNGITPKYLYTIPTLQNPTGSVLSLERRAEVLRLCRDYGVPILEDECYADLLWEGDGPSPLRALDDGSQVLHIGSFSKSLAPALRVGYLVAPWEVMSRLIACKSDGGCGALDQIVVADYCRRHLADHTGELRQSLKSKLESMVTALNMHFGAAAEFRAPPGGMFIWVRFPAQVDAAKLFQPCLDEGVAFNPGSEWSTEPSAAKHCMRLCFAYPSEDEIYEGIARLAAVFRRETSIPPRSANVAHE